MRDINSRKNALAKKNAIYYHALLGLPTKGRATKGWLSEMDLELLDLLNGLELGCYQPSPEVLIH